MITKHQSVSFGVLFVLAVLLPAATDASTIGFQRSTVSVKPGEIFTVSISIVPDAPAQYTARFVLQFPPTLVEVSSFSFDPRWLPLPQNGYNLIDTTNGQLIKTGGIPGGFKSPTTFGTITFTAKAIGEGMLTVGSNSFILNDKNKNTLSERPQIALRVGTTTEGSLTVPESLPLGEQSLFDVSLGTSVFQSSWNWVPWVLGAVFFCFVLLCFIEARRW